MKSATQADRDTHTHRENKYDERKRESKKL